MAPLPPPPAGAPPPPTGVLTKLKGLYLSDTRITDAGCATVASALESGALPALEALHLYGIPASAAAIAAVYACDMLEGEETESESESESEWEGEEDEDEDEESESEEDEVQVEEDEEEADGEEDGESS